MKVIKKLSIFTLVFFSLIGIIHANDVTFKIEVTPDRLQVGQSADLTITALDKDGDVFSDFVGIIYITSINDQDAKLPNHINSGEYEFSPADGGVVKFENGVSFTRPGVMDITVFDADMDIDRSWMTSVEITENILVPEGDIAIFYPEDGMTITETTFYVKGKTKANHNILINLDGENEYSGISDSDGDFQVELQNIPTGQHAVSAKVLNANDDVMGSSENIFFNISNDNPEYIQISLTPDESQGYEASTSILAQVQATPDLERTEIEIHGVRVLLHEEHSGIYEGMFLAPDEEGRYGIDVYLTNELGMSTSIPNATTIDVYAPEVNAGGPATQPVTPTPPVEPNCAAFQSELDVHNPKVVKMKSYSILSWDSVPKATSYNVYKKDKTTGDLKLVENVVENKFEIYISGDTVEHNDFAIKAVFKDDVCNVEGLNYSDMTSVQTGPKEILFVVIALLGGAVVFLRRKKQA